MSSKELFSTREIVTVSLLASLGGALSTFVGYLGNLINLALGVPFGAGQFMAGLHVFWLILIRTMVPKQGTATFGGLLKGLVELFTGSTHGIVIVLVSLTQGILVDIAATIGRNPSAEEYTSRFAWWIGGGIAAASNVIVFQIIYFSGTPVIYIFVITVLAFCSGVIFAGYFAWETLEFLHDAGYLSYNLSSLREEMSIPARQNLLRRNVPAVLMILFLTVGSTFYVTFVAQVWANPQSCQIIGEVEHPFTFSFTTYEDHLVTIEAELNGAYTHIPLTNYTGVLVSQILLDANPLENTTMLDVIARDGYRIPFELEDILVDPQFLLTQAEDGLWLIAAEYDGSMWVRQVTTLLVY